MKKMNWMQGLICFAVMGIVTVAPLYAQDAPTPTPEEVNQWVEARKFQFVPNPLQNEESHAAMVQGYFYKTPGFPLWLLMDMGGAVKVDEQNFLVNEAKQDEDGTWIMNLSCVDSVNGFFQLGLAVDPKTADAVLKLATATDGDIAIYQGKIAPYEERGMPEFKNDKQQEEAIQTAQRLDTLVPAMKIHVKLRSELYGAKSEVNVLGDKIWLWDPRQFSMTDYDVVCCEKQNGIWYVRLRLAEGTEMTEEMYLDLAIDSWTGDVHYRRGFADRLRANWMAMVDGQVDGVPDPSTMDKKTQRKLSRPGNIGMHNVE